MSRCASRKGAGDGLACCRTADHADTGTEDAGHCWHWQAYLRGMPAHLMGMRAGNGHPIVCGRGQQLDA